MDVAPQNGSGSPHVDALARKRSERPLLLSELLMQLLEFDEAEQLMNELFPQVAAHLEVDTYFNFMVDRSGSFLTLRSHAGITEEQAAIIQRLDFGQALCGMAAAGRQPLILDDKLLSEHPQAAFLRDLGVRAYACNPLMINDRLLGTLSFASRTRPAFEEEELEFLRVVAQYTAVALDRIRNAAEIRERSRTLEVLNRLGRTIAEDLNLENIVQAATDAAREVSGAAFGAFFYNSINERGEPYGLYTVSGAPREVFEKLRMPRNTELFSSTFHGEGIVRIPDVLDDPRYGHMAPHHGMPQGHLPVRSYLAAPVISRSGEVLGGLFLGHPEPHVFSEQSEGFLAAIAAQAAIAMDNAMLYEQSRRGAEHLRLAMSASKMGHWSWDAETDVVTLSESAARLFRIPPGPHMTWTEMQQLLHPDDQVEVKAAVERAAADRTDYHAEYRIRRSDGEDLWVAAWGGCAYDANDRLLGMQGVVQNVTARKRAEKALRDAKEAAEAANRSKDKFLAVLSHELRTPLTPVLMTVSAYAADPELPPKIREDMDMVRRNVELETRIIDDLLDLSRITSGKLKLRLEPVELNQAVEHVCEICLPQIQEKGIHLECDYDPAAGHVDADPSRLQQVIWNVVKNAVKFTGEDGRIEVKTRRSGSLVQIVIRDNGVGISEEILPRVFDAFEQGGEGVTREFGGLGLGLAISKALIELHHGSIGIESRGQGRGTQVRIELPAIPEASLSVPRPQSAARRGESSHAPLRVLVVEDHADTAAMLGRLLTASGFQVSVTGNAAQALQIVKAGNLDVIVSDIGLPDSTGYDLMRQVRQIAPQMIGIAMSGYGMEADIRKSADAGFQEHLVKPVAIPVLVDALRRVAAGRQ
jgi:PAS domain S-box-containing protein